MRGGETLLSPNTVMGSPTRYTAAAHPVTPPLSSPSRPVNAHEKRAGVVREDKKRRGHARWGAGKKNTPQHESLLVWHAKLWDGRLCGCERDWERGRTPTPPRTTTPTRPGMGGEVF